MGAIYCSGGRRPSKSKCLTFASCILNTAITKVARLYGAHRAPLQLKPSLLTVTFYRNRSAGLIDSYERKHAVCDAKFFASHIARYPYLYWNGHRGSTDPFYPRITSNGVPYPYWLEKRHPFHRYSH